MHDIKILVSALLYVTAHALSLVLKPVCVLSERLTKISHEKLSQLQKPTKCAHKIVVESSTESTET